MNKSNKNDKCRKLASLSSQFAYSFVDQSQVREARAPLYGQYPVGNETDLVLEFDGPVVVVLLSQEVHDVAPAAAQLPLVPGLVNLVHRGLPVLEV